jgi:hypothetical protein
MASTSRGDSRMTHEELLAKLWILPADVTELQHGAKTVQALRVIVELHKPNSIPDWVSTEEKLMCWCAHIYPCPTIQAIEKELVNG